MGRRRSANARRTEAEPVGPYGAGPLAADVVRGNPGCTTGFVADRLGMLVERAADVMYRTGRAEGIGQDLSERWWSRQDNPLIAERAQAGLPPGFAPCTANGSWPPGGRL